MRGFATLVFGGTAALWLAGCVPEDGFPSLAPRPGERDLSTEEPERTAIDPASDPALRARVAGLRREAGEGNRDFQAILPAAEAAVGSAGARETDSWVTAQLALSRLETARARTMRALSELDRIALERAAEPTAADDFALVLAAVEAVEAIAADQQARIDALRARLSGR